MSRSKVLDGLFEDMGEGRGYLSWLAANARRAQADYGEHMTEDVHAFCRLGASGNFDRPEFGARLASLDPQFVWS